LIESLGILCFGEDERIWLGFAFNGSLLSFISVYVYDTKLKQINYTL
jgi:hypothetical protein